MDARIYFSRPEIFLIAIIVGKKHQDKEAFLSDLRKYIPDRKNRIPGNYSENFLNDIYKSLKNCNIIDEINTGKIVLSEKAYCIYVILQNKADLFSCDITNILQDILYHYHKSIFDIGPDILNDKELIIFEQNILVSNPIINTILTVLQNLNLEKGKSEFTSEEIFYYAIINYRSIMREYFLKAKSILFSIIYYIVHKSHLSFFFIFFFYLILKFFNSIKIIKKLFIKC